MEMAKFTAIEMIDRAKSVLRPRQLANDNTAGDVACALLSNGGNLYLGVCIDIVCGIGFCAEHSAITAMITAGETGISKIVAVSDEGAVLPPCGRCREFMNQIDSQNLDNTDIVLGASEMVKLRALLPYPYQDMG